MNEISFRNGRFYNFLLYFFSCVVIGSHSFFNNRIDNRLNGIICVLLFISVIYLLLATPDDEKKRIHYVKIQCVLFEITNILFCHVFSSANLLIFLFLIQSIFLTAYANYQLYCFQTLVMTLTLALLVIGKNVVSGMETVLGNEFWIGVLCVVIGQLICINRVKASNIKDEHMQEQEQSMDDMMQILELKCLEARQATQSKSNFLSNMSHEIRTPINSILGSNEMILRECHDEHVREYASDIDSSGRMLLSLINDVLDFSKIESGNMEIVPTTYRMSDFLNNLLDIIWVPAKEKGLGLVLEIDKNLPSELYGDDVRFHQVFINLLTNAIKYTETGTVTLRIEGEYINEFRVVLHCEVRDTGIGIKEDELPGLFQAFRRIEEKKTRHIQGTGLGLPITYHILELMGSKLEVDSIYGTGSVFSFSLKQDVVDERPFAQSGWKLRSHSPAERYKPGLYAPEAQVLVVDDNEMNCKVFRNLLKASGVQVTTVNSGKACLEIVKKQQFDVIFLDHMMPEMDGIETLHHIQGMKNLSDTPIVALTANAVSGAKEMYLSEGFDEFLPKPIMPDKLEGLLIELIPLEKLLEVPEAPTRDGPEGESGEEELPMVDGIDWNFAMTHFTDQKMLLHTVQDFYKMLVYEADKLEGFFKSMEEEGQLSAYQIQVHGMKSAAALIGIIPLSGCAKVLEDAAKKGDLDTIYQVTPVFLREWRGFKERLLPFAGEEGEVSKKEDDSELLALLSMLQGAADGMDMDTMDEIMEQLPQYRMSVQAAGLMDDLAAAVTNLETETIINITNEIIEELKITR